MHTYKVTVTREDKWWMITVPELEGHIGRSGAVNFSTVTQARRVSEIDSQAADFICTVTDQAPSEVGIEIVSIEIPGVGDVLAASKRVEKLRAEAARLEAEAAEAGREYAKMLTRDGVPVRDTAELLHVSPQRVSQLANA